MSDAGIEVARAAVQGAPMGWPEAVVWVAVCAMCAVVGLAFFKAASS